MKKILLPIMLLLALLGTFSETFALARMDYRSISSYPAGSENRTLNFGGFLTVYFSSIADYESIPESYQYIDLKFLNVDKGTPLYTALQKGVYMGFFKNLPIRLKTKDPATFDQFARALESNLGQIVEPKSGPLTLGVVLDTLNAAYSSPEIAPVENINVGSYYPITDVSNFAILNDVYVKLKQSHYDGETFRDESLIQWAAKGMAEASGDKHTAYFPPAESQSFQDSLAGEFQWIGAYIDMPKPGELHIISPMSGTPSEKAGLKWGDLIKKIDDMSVTEKTTLEEAVSKIKGPIGTSVRLHIQRGTEELDFSIVRAKITIQYVEYKKLDNGDQNIKITTFGAGVARAFKETLETIAKDPSNGKVILDLRNNPGGSLDEVAMILNEFVPKGSSVVHIKYKNTVSEMQSEGSWTIDWTRKKLVILMNGGSASASEIMAGTIKDYLPDTTRIVGEKSYGKGSVQSLDGYADGSSFKYTIAKWFTGKTQTGIDGIGIKPDIEVIFDEALGKNGRDNQMEYAKGLYW